MSSETVFYRRWRSLKTTAHLIKLTKKTVWVWKKIMLKGSKSHDNKESETLGYIAIIFSLG